METRIWTGHQHRPDGYRYSLILNLERIWSWSITAGRSLKVVRTGCWDVRTYVSWYRSFLIQYRGSGRLERLTDGRPDGMARSSGRLTGNLNSFDLQPESSDITLNSGIPVYNIFYIQVFLSIHRMRPIKLTNSPFSHSGTKNTWPVWKYIPGPNQKLLPLFVTNGQRVKQSNKNQL
jgi:hypothetical protein